MFGLMQIHVNYSSGFRDGVSYSSNVKNYKGFANQTCRTGTWFHLENETQTETEYG